jgi:hypothetical protein
MPSYGGAYKMESGESRALASINTESYDYRDQAKLMSKLTGDVSYMAQYMRTMQRGIDSANENFIQQLNDFILEIFALVQGKGDVGFAFGDLKYVFQAIGALFGFDQQTGLAAVFPINLFDAAWHFFSTYIFPISSPANFLAAIRNAVDLILEGLLATFGDLPFIGSALEAIISWISEVRTWARNVGQIIDRFFNAFGLAVSTTLGNIASFLGINRFIDNVGTFFKSIGFDVANFDLITAATNFIRDVLNPVNWINNAQNFFGQINAGLLGLIPGSHLADVAPNLLTNPSFDAAGALVSDAVWSWDGTAANNHTSVAGSGSAKVTPTGADKDLWSDLIQVSEGQQITISGWVKWASLTRTAGSFPVSLGITSYTNTGTDNNPVWSYAGAVESAVTTSTLADIGWQQLNGTYMVPVGIKAIRMRCHVGLAATGGTVWFDDLSLKKTSKIPTNLVEGLTYAIGDFNTRIGDLLTALGLRAFITDVENVINTITEGAGKTLAALGTWIANVFKNTGLLQGAQIIGAIADNVVTGLGNTWESIWYGLTGFSVTGKNHEDIKDLFTQQAAALTGANSRLQVLEGKVGNGVAVSDVFNRVGTTLNPSGTTYWSAMPAISSPLYGKESGALGTIYTDGNNAQWSVDGNKINTLLYRWVGPNQVSSTDYQNVGIVLASQSQDPAVGASAYVQLLSRVSTDGLNYIRLQVGTDIILDNNIQLYYCKNGSEVLLYSGDHFPGPGSGSSVNLFTGVPGDSNRKIQVFINGQPIQLGANNYITDTGSVSMLGENYRGWGFGMTSGTGWLYIPGGFKQAMPGKINAWVGQDQ